jgi:hypothetical protein
MTTTVAIPLSRCSAYDRRDLTAALPTGGLRSVRPP